MKKILLFLLIICLIACKRKHIKSIGTCDNKLYVEVYTKGIIDEGEEFLTDSANFRIYVGVKDNEHNFFYYQCKDDTLFIQLLTRDMDSFGNRKVLMEKKYIISKIKGQYSN